MGGEAGEGTLEEGRASLHHRHQAGDWEELRQVRLLLVLQDGAAAVDGEVRGGEGRDGSTFQTAH